MSRTFQPRSRPSTAELPLGSSPIGSDGSCLEATLVVSPGEWPHVRLAQLAWGVGVGWYAQHTIDLNLDEAHELARLLDRVPSSLDSEPLASAPVTLAEYRERKARRVQSAGRSHRTEGAQEADPTL